MLKKNSIYTKVCRAVLEIIDAGAKPSARKVIDIMGQGSFSTVCPILSELREISTGFKKTAPILKVLNKSLAQEQISKSTEIEQLSYNLDRLERENFQLQKQLLEANTQLREKRKYQELYDNLRAERESFAKATASVRSDELSSIFSEVKEINIEHNRQQVELGSRLEDKLLQKEIEIIHLKDQINALLEKKQEAPQNLEKISQLKRSNQRLQDENARLVGQLQQLKCETL